MRIALGITLAVFSLATAAEESAEVILTNGQADYSVVTNMLFISSTKKHKVEVPQRITTGDTLTLRYAYDGKSFEVLFPVVAISTRSNICWLHSSNRGPHDQTMDNSLTIQPCRKA